MYFQREALHISLHVTDAQPLRWEHMHCQHWGQSTVTLRLAGFWSGGDQPWRHGEEAEAPADPLERRRKGPSSGRTVCRTHPSSTGAHLSPVMLMLRGPPTALPTQFLKMYFPCYSPEHWGNGLELGKTLMSMEIGCNPPTLVHMDEGS